MRIHQKFVSVHGLIVPSIANLTMPLSAHPCDRPTDGWTDGIGTYGMIGVERSVISALAFVPNTNLTDGK